MANYNQQVGIGPVLPTMPVPTPVAPKPPQTAGIGPSWPGQVQPVGQPPVPVAQPPAPAVQPLPPRFTPAGNGNSGIVPPPISAPPAQFGAGQVIQDYTNNLTDSNSPYMLNARRRGLEEAASRGNLNSSIAAGASQRSALEAAAPLVQQMNTLGMSREGYASQDWLNNNQYNRDFSSALAMMPIKNSYDMLNTLMSYGASNPSVYTPTVMSGLSNFFTQNMQDIMSQYFGS